MLIYKYLNWSKLVIFQFYLHLEKYYYDNIFNTVLVTIGGSNDIYICLNGPWSLETLYLAIFA